MYLSKYGVNARVAFSLSWDSRMINSIDSSDNFFSFSFFSPFSFFFFSLFLSFLLPPREWSVYTVPDHGVCFFACITLALHRQKEVFAPTSLFFSFDGGSCFLRASVSSFTLWCEIIFEKFEYLFIRILEELFNPCWKKIFFIFFPLLLNLLRANPLFFGERRKFFSSRNYSH